MNKRFEKEVLRMCCVCQLSESACCSPLFEANKFARCGGCGKVFCNNMGNIGENLCSSCKNRIKNNVKDGILIGKRLIRKEK